MTGLDDNDRARNGSLPHEPEDDAVHWVEGQQPTTNGASHGRERPTLIDASRVVSVDASWICEAPPKRAYLATDSRTGRGAIEARGAYLLAAAGGAGKSYATIDLALAVAVGGTWLGTLNMVRPGRVLIVSAEEPAEEIRRRLYYVARSAHVATISADTIDILDVHDVHVPLLGDEGHPSSNATALIDLVRERGPYSLVIIDPIARVAGAPIDADNVAACALISVLESIATAAHGLVFGVLHTSLAARKAGIVDATAVRGATGLGDSARMVLVLSVEQIKHGDAEIAARLGEIVTVRCAKVNHVRAWAPIELRRGDHGELIALDSHDREMVAETRRGSDRSATKRKAREADHAERKAVEEHERAAKAAERSRATVERANRIDAEVVAAVRERPGIGASDLRIAIKARAECGADHADVAVRRTHPTAAADWYDASNPRAESAISRRTDHNDDEAALSQFPPIPPTPPALEAEAGGGRDRRGKGE